jgi:hypothetical protein
MLTDSCATPCKALHFLVLKYSVNHFQTQLLAMHILRVLENRVPRRKRDEERG